jgi:UDP-N-acetylmuramoyl-tripeptide--D-alanyl-D-alanine ligase
MTSRHVNTDEADRWWTAGALRRAIGGQWASWPDADDEQLDAIPLRGAAVDSREVDRDNVFFSLRGERTDGHRYLQQASEAGAAIAIIAGLDHVDPVDREHLPMLIVPSGAGVSEGVDPVGEALALAGRAYRTDVLRAVVVAVTGSNGKTTVVRLIATMLETAARRVGASRRSYNTRVGVPVSLLNTDPSAEIVVCEAGMSLPGEIAELGAILRPDVGVVTLIGHAHLEGLGSTHGIAVEKSALLDAIEPGGLAVINGATRHADVLLGMVPAHARRVLVAPAGAEVSADLRFAVRGEDDDGLDVDLAVDGDQPERVRVSMAGQHNAANAALAAAVVMSLPRRLAIDFDGVRAGLLHAETPPMRLSRREIGGVLVVNDAYNANPESMLAALMTFDRMAGRRRRVMVLGDMLELGEAQAPAHEELGIVARRAHPHVAVWIGAASQHAAKSMLAAESDQTTDQAADQQGTHEPDVHWHPELDLDAVLALIQPGDAVLLKGSRSLGLERVEAAIEAHVAMTNPDVKADVRAGVRAGVEPAVD